MQRKLQRRENTLRDSGPFLYRAPCGHLSLCTRGVLQKSFGNLCLTCFENNVVCSGRGSLCYDAPKQTQDTFSIFTHSMHAPQATHATNKRNKYHLLERTHVTRCQCYSMKNCEHDLIQIIWKSVSEWQNVSLLSGKAGSEVSSRIPTRHLASESPNCRFTF